MRFTIDKETFIKALNLVSKPVPTKSYVASLVFIKLALNDMGLNLVGSNEILAISTTISFSEKMLYNIIIRRYIMSTRGLYAIRYNGVDKGTYNHSRNKQWLGKDNNQCCG